LSKAAANGRPVVHLISESETRRDVVPVAVELRAIVAIHGHEAQASVQIREAGDLAGERRTQPRIEPAQTIVALRARSIEIVPDADVQRQLAGHAPVVLNVESLVEALRRHILPVLIEVSVRSRAEQE